MRSVCHYMVLSTHLFTFDCIWDSTFASSVLKAVYGIEVAERGDKIVDTVELAMEGVALGLTPGAFLVEYLPFLRYVPEWLPGAGFQKRLRRWRDASHTMVDLPFEEAKMAMVSSAEALT